MTVLIYVDTSKKVGDPDHLKVFVSEVARQHLAKRITSEGVDFRI